MGKVLVVDDEEAIVWAFEEIRCINPPTRSGRLEATRFARRSFWA